MLTILPEKSTLLVLVILGGVVSIAVLTAFPNLVLALKAQSLHIDAGASVVKTLRWNVPEALPLGERVVTIRADDGDGGVTEKQVTINVQPGAIAILNPTVEVKGTEADFSFETSRKLKDRIIVYDVREENLRGKKEVPVIQSTKEHTIQLKDLQPCTTYTVQVEAKNPVSGGANTKAPMQTFTTSGCPGSAAVQGVARQDISQSQGGSFGFDGKLTVDVPAGFAGSSALFQAHQLERDKALDSLGSPDGLSPVTGLYQLKAFQNADTVISQFSQPISVTVNYVLGQNADSTTLMLYRNDGSSWQKLDNCVTKDGEKTITCTTNHFSVVAGFVAGASAAPPPPEPTPRPTVTPTPTPTFSQVVSSPSSSSGGGGSSSGGGGGGGGGGGRSDSSNEESAVAVKQYVFPAASGHTIAGTYAGVIQNGSTNVVKLASMNDTLTRDVKIAKGDYTFYLRAKHDRPGPVNAAIYLNGRVWKVIKLDKNDNQFRTQAVGTLKSFSGGKIQFRLVRDAYDKRDPGNEDKDLNFVIEAWGLTTGRAAPKNLKGVPVGVGGGSIPMGSGGPGAKLLPGLNDAMKQVGITPSFEVWQYYAWRVTLPTQHPSAITSQQQLLEAMKSWRSTQPLKPYGEITK